MLTPALIKLKLHPFYSSFDLQYNSQTLMFVYTNRPFFFSFDEKTRLINFFYRPKVNIEPTLLQISFENFEKKYKGNIQNIINETDLGSIFEATTLILFNLKGVILKPHSALDSNNPLDYKFNFPQKTKYLIKELAKIRGIRLGIITNVKDPTHIENALAALFGDEWKFYVFYIQNKHIADISAKDLKETRMKKNKHIRDIEIYHVKNHLDTDIIDIAPKNIITADDQGIYLDKLAELYKIQLPDEPKNDESSSETTQVMQSPQPKSSPIATTTQTAGLETPKSQSKAWLHYTPTQSDPESTPTDLNPAEVPETLFSSQKTAGQKHSRSQSPTDATPHSTSSSSSPLYKKHKTEPTEENKEEEEQEA